MSPYADTNFFTRYYLELAESPQVLMLAEEAERVKAPPLPVTWLHRIELGNALQLRLFQGRQPGHPRVTPEQAAAAMATFREDLRARQLLRAAGLPTEDVERQCEELSLRHTARHGFRTYDLLHVSSALLLGCDTFWSFAPKANALADLAGLAIPAAPSA